MQSWEVKVLDRRFSKGERRRGRAGRLSLWTRHQVVDFMNILTSVEVCPPVPHAIIHVLGTGLLEWYGSELVTRPFINCISKRNLNRYIILLFIHKRDTKTRSLESFLYSKSEMLKEYIAACGN
ncbi:GTPase IMAP family member 7, partial [Ophiophagus hannah]